MLPFVMHSAVLLSSIGKMLLKVEPQHMYQLMLFQRKLFFRGFTASKAKKENKKGLSLNHQSL
jgi:hypothetical protein